jgi:hypothetical protein
VSTPIIDPSRNWIPVQERLEAERDPRLRHQLDEVRYHIHVEAACNIQAALERLSPEAEYVLYDYSKEPVVIKGVDQVREMFYDQLAASIHPSLQWTMSRVSVEDGFVVTQGSMKSGMRGSVLAAAGFDTDPDTFYLSEGEHLVIWPFDGQGRLIGETVFQGWTTPLEQVARQPLKLEDIGLWDGDVPLPE